MANHPWSEGQRIYPHSQQRAG